MSRSRCRVLSARLAASRPLEIEFPLSKSSIETPSSMTCRKVGWRP
jgi:hypothetical protein